MEPIPWSMLKFRAMSTRSDVSAHACLGVTVSPTSVVQLKPNGFFISMVIQMGMGF